jgi:hypothetical protein
VLRQDSGALVQKLVAQRKEGKREAMLKDAPPPPEGERVEQPMRSNAMKRDFTGQLSEAKLLRAVESERQLQEVMANCSRPPRTARRCSSTWTTGAAAAAAQLGARDVGKLFPGFSGQPLAGLFA